MTDEHDRYAQLAVGHVLGGLNAPDAAEFRSHLLSCRGCRARVAELRGIAADLAAAERDERARLPLRTATREQPSSGPVEVSEPRITVRHVTIAVIVVVLFAGAVAFWNLHLRTVSAGYAAVVEAQGEVLQGLASGVPVDTELETGVTGAVTTDGDDVWVTLAGVEASDDERIVAWLFSTATDADPHAQVLRAGGGDSDGPLAVGLATRGAEQLMVTREPAGELAAPGDDRILTAQIRAPR